MAYSKLHSSIVGSSLWNQSDAVRLLFITLLALCDQDGIAYGSRDGLARIANIEPNEWQAAWDALLAPDPDSSDAMRAPENNGRRIEAVPGGFKLLNFKYYRGLRNDDDRRAQNRAAQAKFKAKVSQGKPEKAHTEAEAEAEAERYISRIPPSLEDVKLLCQQAGLPDVEAEKLFNFYASKGWKVGKQPMRSLPHAVGGWAARWREHNALAAPTPTPFHIKSTKDKEVEKLLEEIERGTL